MTADEAGAAPDDWEPPSQFDGFEVTRPLGRGGMGTVFVGRDVLLDRPVALKFIASRAPDQTARDRFLTEARAIARLHHPNVVGIFRFGDVAGRPYLAYELVAGRPLHLTPLPMPWRQALSLGVGIARGLAAAHQRDILHRDVKPANIMVSESGEAKLLDFGLAKLIDKTEGEGAAPWPGKEGGSLATSTSWLAGTPRYMAPELWRGEAASPQSDLYAVGLVLFELLIGDLPQPATGMSPILAALTREIPTIASQRTDVPSPLAEIIDRCTRRDPRDRPASAEVLRDTLETLNGIYQPFVGSERGDDGGITESFARVSSSADALSSRMYERLFAADPTLRPLFPEDMTKQRTKLIAALQFIVQHVSAPERLVPMLEDLGRRHAGYRVPLSSFATLGDALLATLQEFDRDAWTPELGRAWSHAYARINDTMQRAIVEVRATGSSPTMQVAARPAPRTRYAHSGAATIAYQVIGAGPRDLVFLPSWVSHLELTWHYPRYARFLERLAARNRVVLVDKRGAGMSDRGAAGLTADDRVDDLRAVLDAIGSPGAAMIGVAEAALACVQFAARHPDRTRALVVIGGAARTADDVEAACRQIVEHWGEPLFAERVAPSLAADPAFRDWWAGYLRMAASPGDAAAMMRASAGLDVGGALAAIRAPTLVLHRLGDRVIPIEAGRALATRIAGARFEQLDGDDHLPFAGDADELIDRIDAFLHDAPTVVESIRR